MKVDSEQERERETERKTEKYGDLVKEKQCEKSLGRPFPTSHLHWASTIPMTWGGEVHDMMRLRQFYREMDDNLTLTWLSITSCSTLR